VKSVGCGVDGVDGVEVEEAVGAYFPVPFAQSVLSFMISSEVFAEGLLGVAGANDVTVCFFTFGVGAESGATGTSFKTWLLAVAGLSWYVMEPAHVVSRVSCFGTWEIGTVFTSLFITNPPGLPCGFATFGTAARTVGSTGFTVL